MYKEFVYARQRHKIIVPVMFEPSCVTNPCNGVVQMHVGNNLYIDGSETTVRTSRARLRRICGGRDR